MPNGAEKRKWSMSYSHVFVAGTFDRLHKGHKEVLRRAFESGRQVTIGITSDAFIAQYKQDKRNQIQPAVQRQTAVEQWVLLQSYAVPYKLIQINDPLEPAASSSEYDSLVITQQNSSTGEAINQKRTDSGLAPLAFIVVELVPAEDQQPISSTRIRAGNIDSDGKLLLPEHLRSLLQKPFGLLLTGAAIEASMRRHAAKGIITVGDKTTLTAREFGILPTVSVIDFQVERQAFAEYSRFRFPDTVVVDRFQSGPGYLTLDVIGYIEMLMDSKIRTAHVCIIEGEDDLVALPIMVYAAVGSVVYYGQPGKGVVEVVVTKNVQQQAEKLFKQFVSS